MRLEHVDEHEGCSAGGLRVLRGELQPRATVEVQVGQHLHQRSHNMRVRCGSVRKHDQIALRRDQKWGRVPRVPVDAHVMARGRFTDVDDEVGRRGGRTQISRWLVELRPAGEEEIALRAEIRDRGAQIAR